jgi:hypothetical protein
MAKRLSMRSYTWNAALVALSLASVVAGAALLQEGQLYGPNGDTGMLLLGILVLVASLMVSTANYGDRARMAFENYRALQRLSTELEARVLHGVRRRQRAIYIEFDKRYQDLLDTSSNHSHADHARNVRTRLFRPRIAELKKGKPVANDREYLRLGKLVERRLSQLGTFAMNVFPLLLIGVAVVISFPAILWLASGN